MRYFVVTTFFVLTLSILVWLTLDFESNKHSNDPDCHNTNETISKSHQQYLSKYGWNIKTKRSTCKKVVDYYPEVISTLQSGGLNLEPYNRKGKKAVITTYTLKEKQLNGDKLSATIYEIDGELVGGYGGLENWKPGIFSLDDKERLIEQGTLPK